MYKNRFNTFKHKVPEGDEAIKKIVELLNIWEGKASMLNSYLIITGLIGITGSVFVTSFIVFGKENGFIDPNWIKIISFASTCALVINTSFGIVAKKNSFRNGWKLLNTAYLKYLSNLIDKSELIKAYDEGEKIIGDLRFSFK